MHGKIIDCERGKTMLELARYRKELEGKSARQVIEWSLKQFGKEKLVLASSFGVEDQLLTEMLVDLEKNARIITLDTGRNFEQTYDTMQKTMDMYKIHYEAYCPKAKDVEDFLSSYGPNAIYKDVLRRKECCNIRKIKPLRRALKTADAWICGLRKGQSSNRDEVNLIEFDENFGIYKISPLAFWDEKKVWSYVIEHKIPYNALHDQNYPSIGCAPCTRAVNSGENFRAGRWWWESSEKKECGLHSKDGGKNG